MLSPCSPTPGWGQTDGPNSRAGGRQLRTDAHPPVHVQDAVGVAVHHVDEQLCLCEVHPTLLVHVELGEKGIMGGVAGARRGRGRPLLAAPPALPCRNPSTTECSPRIKLEADH